VLDYFLPLAPAGPLTLEVLGPGGDLVRRFQSDDVPEQLSADVYFADLWRPAPAPLPARAGHNRFVWDLRYPRPRAHEYEYSIAAAPGRPTTLLPQGPFVLPGTYQVRISGAGEPLVQKLIVAQDPRRGESSAELGSLLDFQRQVIAALEQAVASAMPEARTVAEQLTSLETDLEASDAPPTQPQRELLAQCRERLRGLRPPLGR
jgi:hypothetical protein